MFHIIWTASRTIDSWVKRVDSVSSHTVCEVNSCARCENCVLSFRPKKQKNKKKKREIIKKEEAPVNLYLLEFLCSVFMRTQFSMLDQHVDRTAWTKSKKIKIYRTSIEVAEKEENRIIAHTPWTPYTDYFLFYLQRMQR